MRAISTPFAALRRRLEPARSRLSRIHVAWWIAPLAFAIVSVLGIGGAVWGTFFASPPIHVRLFDAGAVDEFAIRKLTTYPEYDLYVVGLDDGRLRAIDARVDSTCSAHWFPDDPRGQAGNPGQVSGAFVDECSGAVWSMLGNALAGTSKPLRTPQLKYITAPGDKQHVYVEMINHPAFP